MSMEPDLEKYQQAMFALFRQQGWEFLVEELQNLHDDIAQLEAVRDNDDLKFRQGQLNVIARIMRLPDDVEGLEIDAENL